MPEKAEKLPKPRMGGTSRPASAGDLVQRFRAHRAFEVDVQVGFRKVAEIAHDADLGTPRGAFDTRREHRNLALTIDVQCRNCAAPMVRFDKSCSGLPGGVGSGMGRVCVRRIRPTRALVGSAIVPAARRRGRCRCRTVGHRRNVRHPRRVRQLLEAGGVGFVDDGRGWRTGRPRRVGLPALVDQERRVRGRVHRRHQRLLQGRGLLEGHAAVGRSDRAAGLGRRRAARRSSASPRPTSRARRSTRAPTSSSSARSTRRTRSRS